MAAVSKLFFRRLLGALACWMLFFSLPRAQGTIVQFKRFDQSSGLPAKLLYHVIRDPDGFLWVAAENGVFRFDGKTFYPYTTREGLCDNEIIEMFADSKGRIWCAGYNGRLSIIENGVVSDAYEAVTKWSSKGFIANITEDEAGNIYLTTQSQFFKIDPDGKVTDYHYEDKGEHITGLLYRNRRLYVFGYYNYYHFDESDGLQDEFMAHVQRKYKWFFLSEEYPAAWAIDNDRKIVDLFGSGQLDREIYAGREVVYLSQVDSRFMVVGYVDGSCIVYDLKWKNARTVDIPKDARVVDAIADNQDNIWLVTEKSGLFAIKYNYDLPSDKPLPGFDGNITNAYKKGDETVAVADNGKLIVSNARGQKRLDLSSDELVIHKTNYVSFKQMRGGIYIVTDKGGYIYRNGAVTGHIGAWLGKEMMAYKDSLMFIRHSLRVVMVDPDDGIPYHLVFGNRTHAIGLQGDRLWISSREGLQFYDIPSARLHDVIYQVPGNGRIEEIIPWKGGLLVLGTSNKGVMLFNGRHAVRSFGVEEGLFDDDCKEIDSCAGGWIVRHPLGLSLVSTSHRRIKTVSQWKGIPISSVNNIAVYGDTVLLSSREGLIATDVHTLFEQLPERRRVKFTRIVSDDRPREPENLLLKHDRNKLRVEFAIPEYNQPELIQYQWRINGAEWNKTNTTVLDLADLKSGSYLLEIKAKAPGFSWSPVSSLRFVVETPFWETFYFNVAMFLCAGLLLWFFLYRRYQKQLAREREKASVQYQLMSFEQKALNAMMNPHFVFNAMGSIQYLLNKGEIEAANDYLVKFSRLSRKSLETSQVEFCSLDDEIERLTLYLQLEKMRLNGRMSFEITVDEQMDTEKINIPTLILQTYVENAVIHGAAAVSRPTHLAIRFFTDGSVLAVDIADDGPGFNPVDTARRSLRFGLSATEKRLALLTRITGKDHHVTVHSPVDGGIGVRVELRFPSE